MKKSTFILPFIFLGLVFLNFSTASAAIEVPENVQQIIDKSCYTCHNTSSVDKKAKKKFDFDKLNYLKKQQAIAEWDKVSAAIIAGEMPPKKFLKKYPDKQLSRTDKQTITSWINGLTQVTEINLESQMNELVEQIVSSLAQNDKSKIAVLDFVNMNGEITKLGRYVSEELTTRLYLTGNFEVIERKLLDKIVEEQKISLSGLVDESTAAELGMVLGVEAIASGTITDLGTSVKVNARLISAETGKLFSVASSEIPKTDKVKVLLSESVTTNGLLSSGSGSTSKKEEAATTKNPVAIGGEFKFELLEARVEGKEIIFKLILTNPTDNDKDFGIFINPYTEVNMAFDDSGEEYYLKRAEYGNKIIDDIRYTTKKIISGTSMNLELYFANEGINPKKAIKITLLALKCTKGYGTPQYKVEFRNIPLKKN